MDMQSEQDLGDQEAADELASQVGEELAAMDGDPAVDDEQVDLLHRYVRLRRHYAADLEAIHRQYDRLRSRAVAKLDALDARYGPQAAAVAKALIHAAGGRRKSIDTPWGRAGFRAGRDKLIVADDQAFARWAEAHGHGELVQRKETLAVDKKATLALIQSNGEELPGVMVEEATDRFYVD